MSKGILWRFGFLLAVLLVVSSGCDLESESDIQDEIRQRVEDRRQQWENQNITDYKLVYSQQVGEVLVDTVNVFVTAGTVDSIRTVPDVSEEELLVGTVDSFFDLIEARIGESESQFTASFNGELGYPTEYTADFQDGRSSQTVFTNTLVDSLGSSNP